MINKKTPIKIYSPSLILLAEIDDYTSFIIKRCYNETGDFSLHISTNKNNTEYLQKNNIIMIDNNKDKVGIIKYREMNLDEKGRELLIIKGFTIDCILNQRNIMLPINENEMIFTGLSGDLIEKLVNENIVSAADPLRNISNLMIQSNPLGQNTVWQIKPSKLGDEISKISKLDTLGYKVSVDLDNKKLIFSIYTGKDLTENQNVNPKVVFSPSLNNIQSMQYIQNSIEEKNVIYINTGNNVLVPYGTVSGLDRQENYLDHGQLKENETIQDLGKNELSKYPEIDSITAEIMPFNTFIYEKDYNLGDIVIVANPKWGVYKDLRITAIEEIYETKQKVNITFGEPSPTFIKKIKNYITNMN